MDFTTVLSSEKEKSVMVDQRMLKVLKQEIAKMVAPQAHDETGNQSLLLV